ncbi:hypothetical protein C8R43DRAFT_881458 [Mycena crocata]|nr:hypothetical protein C8R43DRAFT_881458 [Mycena crocata]
MNAEIRANPTLDAPYFDLAGHLANRAYCLHNVGYASSSSDETAALLDVGVYDLLPTPLPASPAPKLKNAPFAIRPSAGTHGVGMFAAQDIPVGGPILAERPVLITPHIIGLEPEFRSVFLDALLRRLTPSTAARILALANCRPTSECSVLEGIVRTNAIDINLPVPDVPHPELETHRAVFLNASRCNHSCGPNAKWTWDAKSFSLSLEAVRPIPADAEITVAYVATDTTRSIRRAALQATHNFTCLCAFCARPDAVIAQSDAARAELAAFWVHTPAFEDWCTDTHLPDQALVAAHGRALRLIEAEGLEVLGVGAHLDAVAMSYGALGDVDRFRAAAWQARDARHDKAKAKVLQKWIHDPESFPVWGWRKSVTRPERASSHSSPTSPPADYFSIPPRPEYSTSPTGEFSMASPPPLYSPAFPPLYSSPHSSPPSSPPYAYASPPIYSSSPHAAHKYPTFAPPLYSPSLWPNSTYSSPLTTPWY